MAADLAGLADLLPADSPGPVRARWLRLLWRGARARGIETVPERYRLQFLILASDRMPGASPAAVAEAAGRLAESVRVPRGLDTGEADAWFKANAGRIVALAGEMLAG